MVHTIGKFIKLHIHFFVKTDRKADDVHSGSNWPRVSRAIFKGSWTQFWLRSWNFSLSRFPIMLWGKINFESTNLKFNIAINLFESIEKFSLFDFCGRNLFRVSCFYWFFYRFLLGHGDFSMKTRNLCFLLFYIYKSNEAAVTRYLRYRDALTNGNTKTISPISRNFRIISSLRSLSLSLSPSLPHPVTENY